jgi:hypothetical protein
LLTRIPQRLLTGLTGFTGFPMKPGESNPVHPVHPVEKAQRHSAAHTPIPSEIHPFSHVVRRVWDGCAHCSLFRSWERRRRSEATAVAGLWADRLLPRRARIPQRGLGQERRGKSNLENEKGTTDAPTNLGFSCAFASQARCPARERPRDLLTSSHPFHRRTLGKLKSLSENSAWE